MATVDAELQRISRIADQKEKTAAYKTLLEDHLQDQHSLKTIVTHLLGEDVLLVISRAVITHLASVVSGIDVDAHPWKLEFICFCLAKIKPRILSFEEPDVLFRESLAAMYMDEEEYIEAAKALAAINLESSTRQYTDVEKAEKYVKIAELYLQEDETVDAENFINRASRFIHNVEDWALKLRFQVSYARILDAKRKFLDAALRYYEFSQSKPDEVDPDDLLELLSKAVTCAILASAGPQRSRLLGTLYKDERVKNSEHVAILEKMYTEQLIRRPELVQFEKSLLPHQRAVLSNGFTVLENAFLEHNLLAASRVYSSIALVELGKLLEIEPANAERVAATMIGEDRMKGSIDQHLGFLEFENMEDEVLAAFDTRISSLCFNVNQCAEQIEQQYPDIARSLTATAT
ncbi:PCI domain-containing protein [Phytophthora infestans]|uniref:COP9 signalosome complex subunit 4 n=1 Tax=Phytophthora infestans TaxID=4787 RepID=A0A8S9UUQ3_PHYIN|nr:PCI domain-containing protein [Phytophthora infestans]